MYPKDYFDVIDRAKTALYDIRKRAGNHDNKHPTYVNILCKIEDDQLFYFWYYQEYKRQRMTGCEEPLMVDRINNMGHYEMKNIQLIPMSVNEKKKAEDHAIQHCGRIPKQEEKYCHSCHTIQIREKDFHKDSHELDGFRGNCKKCTLETNKRSRDKKINVEAEVLEDFNEKADTNDLLEI